MSTTKHPILTQNSVISKPGCCGPWRGFRTSAVGFLAAAFLLAALLPGRAQTTVSVDNTRTWLGYMNVFGMNPDGSLGGYLWGSAWGPADLRAIFDGTNSLTLTPCTNVWNPTNTYWVNPDGTPNKWMDANFYVQDDTLGGQQITFAGTCLSNSLTSPTYCLAFIKDFVPDYSSSTAARTTLDPGQPFVAALQTTAGHHIQYGFEMMGPDVNPTNLVNVGNVVLAVNNADPSLSSVPGQIGVEGQNIRFTVVATGTAPFSYQWTYVNATTTNDLVNGGRISGATTNSLVISNLVEADAGTYFVTVTNSRGSAVAISSLAVVPLAQAQTNMLVDPGFEGGVFALTPDAGWVGFNGSVFQSTNNYYYNTTVPVVVHDGTNCFETYPTGSGSYNGVYQDRPALPGQIYTGNAWFLTSALDPILGAGACYLEVQFRTAAGAVLAQYKSSYVDTNSPTDTWINLTPTNKYTGDFTTFLGTSPYMVAPAGTAKVRFQITYHGDLGGAIYVDTTDLRLRSPVAAASLNGPNVQIGFPTIYGPTYQVWYKTNLMDSAWQPLSSVFGDGTAKTVTDPHAGAGRFYTVSTQ